MICPRCANDGTRCARCGDSGTVDALQWACSAIVDYPWTTEVGIAVTGHRRLRAAGLREDGKMFSYTCVVSVLETLREPDKWRERAERLLRSRLDRALREDHEENE